MKKILSITGAMIFASVFLIIAGCGEKEKKIIPVMLKPSSTVISGAFTDVFEVVDGGYTLEKNYRDDEFDGARIQIQIRRTDKEYEFDKNAVSSFICQFFDENQSPCATIDISEGYGSQAFTQLKNLKPNQTGVIEFYHNTIGITEEGASKAKTFTLSSTIETKDGEQIAEKEITVKPDTSTITGELTDVYEIVPGNYILEKEFNDKSEFTGCRLKLQLIKTSKKYSFAGDSYHKLTCQFFDEKKMPCAKIFSSGYQLNEMKNLKPTQTTWVEFYCNTIGINEDEADKARTFTMSSIIE
jgi:hypothetical protein